MESFLQPSTGTNAVAESDTTDTPPEAGISFPTTLTAYGPGSYLSSTTASVWNGTRNPPCRLMIRLSHSTVASFAMPPVVAIPMRICVRS